MIACGSELLLPLNWVHRSRLHPILATRLDSTSQQLGRVASLGFFSNTPFTQNLALLQALVQIRGWMEICCGPSQQPHANMKSPCLFKVPFPTADVPLVAGSFLTMPSCCLHSCHEIASRKPTFILFAVFPIFKNLGKIHRA